MGFRIRAILYLVALAFLAKTTESYFMAVSDMMQIVLNVVQNAKNMIEHGSNVTDAELLKQIHSFNDRFETVDAILSEMTGDSVKEIVEMISNSVKMEIKVNDITQMLEIIDTAHENLKKYSKMKGGLEKATLIDFSESVISHKPDSVKSIIDRIHGFIKPSKMGQVGLMTLIKQEVSKSTCVLQETQQQVLYNVFNVIQIAEIKVYALVQFSYMLLKINGKGNFTSESILYSEAFRNRIGDTIKLIKDDMKTSSREFWMCDPDTPILGVTYVEITKLMQGYLTNEVDLNKGGTCTENCAAYKSTKAYSCYEKDFCKHQKKEKSQCKGTVRNCEYIEAHMTVCPSVEDKKRYDYIEYTSGQTIGRKQTCSAKTYKVKSWWRDVFWHCSYCFCFCDDEKDSDRYFSLENVVSSYSENRVVTGVRLTKHSGVIHFQIQEGKLLPHGVIDRSTVTWRPVKHFKISDKNKKLGSNYYQLTWKHRSIDLDDIETDNDHVITGVRFEKRGDSLSFGVQITSFDFVTGELRSERAWKSLPQGKRSKISIQNADVPTRTTVKAQVQDNDKKYVEFTHTSIEKDAAQSTIPFIDTQKVETKSAGPLSGIGLYFKTQAGHGGYIGPKIISYDYANRLNDVQED